jgi:sulfur carrier protein ThiS adenylyltransferase
MKSDELIGSLPPREQFEAMMTARHTPGIHNRLKKAKVAIAGLGGLGSHIAVSLARIGVGSMFLVDFDVVELSNLNRQSYYVRHLGMPKTQALREQIEQINPFLEIRLQTVRVEEHNVAGLFGGYDILCEAFDNQEAKAMLVSTALSGLPHLKVVAASGMAGYGSSNSIRTERRMKNLYVCGDCESGAERGAGLMAPRVQICAGHQANMVLRILIGIEEP